MLLAQDLAIRFKVCGELNHAVEHVVEDVVWRGKRELLGHEVDARALHAFEPVDGVFEFPRAIRAVDLVELE